MNKTNVGQLDQTIVALLFAAVVLLLASAGGGEIPRAEDAPQPLSPDHSQAHLQLPDGFRIELVASEPLIADPSGVAFDARGRMFVSELHGYNMESHIDTQELNKTGELDTQVRRVRWEREGGPIAEQAARLQFGRVKLLHDTDGDGRMDKADLWGRSPATLLWTGAFPRRRDRRLRPGHRIPRRPERRRYSGGP